MIPVGESSELIRIKKTLGIRLRCLFYSQIQQRQSDGQISQQLQSFPSSKQDTLSTFYIQICAITHGYGLVYTVARGKDVGGKNVPVLSLSPSQLLMLQ